MTSRGLFLPIAGLLLVYFLSRTHNGPAEPETRVREQLPPDDRKLKQTTRSLVYLGVCGDVVRA